MKNVIITIGVLLLWSFNLPGQEKCRVLMSSISVEYKGDCKNGLADGRGEAFGVDHYIGHFRKGLPDGEGVYTWSTGEVYKGSFKKGMRHGHGSYTFKLNGRDTTLTGRWQKDKYIEENLKKASYTILFKNNIGRITVNRLGEGNAIRLKFYRNGGEIAVSDLSLIGDSGDVMTYRDFTGFDHVSFPFSAKLLFSIPNDFYSAVINCELKFRINTPGSYEVRIYP